MSMVVQHNLQAMNSNRMLGITTSAQSKSTEKLSSGYKTNRAADDAAGLTISEKMRKQMRGLNRASTNAQDGVSAVQTAEGALTEVHSMLQRMNELAVQASNGTNSEADRKAIQDEVNALSTEIDRVAETTKFNEIYLLKGDANGEKKTQTLAAHDAGLDGALVDNGDGTSTFTPGSLEDGAKVTIAGTKYTISDPADGTTPPTSASVVKKGIQAAMNDVNAAANDKIEITKGTDTATYTLTDEIAGDTLAKVKTDVATAQAAANDGDTLDVTAADGTVTNYTLTKGTSEADTKTAVAAAVANTNKDQNDTIKVGTATYTYFNQGGTNAKTATAIKTDLGTAIDNAGNNETITFGGVTYTKNGANWTPSDGGTAIATNDLKTLVNNYDFDIEGEKVESTVTAGGAINGDYYVGTTSGWYDAAGNALDATAALAEGTTVEVTIAGDTTNSKTYTVGADSWATAAGVAFSADDLKAGDKVTIGGGDHTVGREKGWYDANGKALDPNMSLANGTEVQITVANKDADAPYEDAYTVGGEEGVIKKADAVALMKSALEQASAIGADDPTAVKATFDDTTGAFTITQGSVEISKALSFNLHVGADADMTNKIDVKIETMNSAYLGIQDLNVVGNGNDGGTSATYAIDAIADAISKVSAQRSALGAVQNRLEHTISNLDNVVENTTAAESRIRDTDMAEEMVEYSKNNILAQAGQSMLAQANQSTQGVLSLLG